MGQRKQHRLSRDEDIPREMEKELKTKMGEGRSPPERGPLQAGRGGA